MKTAREHAHAAYEFAAGTATGRLSEEGAINAITALFKEHARDQRHLIAERLSGWDALPLTTDDAHAVAMNARAPGESDA